MPRIRSVHPGFFTDADIVGMSDSAQLLFIGLWTEADDYGVFEWKPTSLKIKLRPASTAPVDPLLAELTSAERVVRYEHGGRQYGAIRNFCRYQRPKSPKSIHPITPEIRRVVGLTPPISEIAEAQPPPIPPKGEISPQMEDGGGRREDEGGKITPLVQKPQSVARARSAPASYAFGGSVIRLSQTDFDRWKASFSAIPDLTAELETIDAKLVDEGFEGKWFGRVSGWLRGRHEELLKRRNGEDEAYRGVI